MKKKVLASLMAAVMALGLAACGGSSASGTASGTTGGDASGDPEVKLVMAEVNPLDTIVGMTDKYFADKVEEYSGGTVHIDLQDSGVLGSENDVLDSMLGGDDSIDISRISAFVRE